MQMYGLPLPEDWFPYGTGDLCPGTSRPRMAPRGGPLGYGLAVVACLLAGPLVGGPLPIERTRDSATHFFLAIDVGHLTSTSEFSDAVDKWILHLRSTSKADDSEVMIPGELEARRFKAWREDGLPLHQRHLESLTVEAMKLGVEPPRRKR